MKKGVVTLNTNIVGFNIRGSYFCEIFKKENTYTKVRVDIDIGGEKYYNCKLRKYRDRFKIEYSVDNYWYFTAVKIVNKNPLKVIVDNSNISFYY